MPVPPPVPPTPQPQYQGPQQPYQWQPPEKKPWYKNWKVWAVIVAVFVVVGIFGGSEEEEKVADAQDPVVEVVESEEDEKAKAEEEAKKQEEERLAKEQAEKEEQEAAEKAAQEEAERQQREQEAAEREAQREAEKAAAEAAKHQTVGGTLTDDGVSITLVNATTTNSVDGFLDAASGKVFLVCTFEIQNDSSSSFHFYASDIDAIDSRNQEVGVAYGDSIFTDNFERDINLLPGGSATYTCAYEVSQGGQVTLKWNNGFFGGNTGDWTFNI